MIENTTAPVAQTPAPTQPAAPQVEVQKENSFLAFVKDHWAILAVGLVGLAAFFIVPQFKELSYGLMRAAITVLFIALLVYTWFRHTLREYLVSGAFVAEFRALEAKHRVAVTVTVLVLISWIVVECIVHP
jgi:hydrogenase-4 membrane subunit HyfE